MPSQQVPNLGASSTSALSQLNIQTTQLGLQAQEDRRYDMPNERKKEAYIDYSRFDTTRTDTILSGMFLALGTLLTIYSLAQNLP
jgi:hypothetical protein